MNFNYFDKLNPQMQAYVRKMIFLQRMMAFVFMGYIIVAPIYWVITDLISGSSLSWIAVEFSMVFLFWLIGFAVFVYYFRSAYGNCFNEYWKIRDLFSFKQNLS